MAPRERRLDALLPEVAWRTPLFRGASLASLILDSGDKPQTDRTITALLVLAVMGVTVYTGLERVERAGLRWRRGR